MTDGREHGVERASPRKPTRRYEARRNAIIASAVDQLNLKGLRGMTLGDVAASLDLVPTGVIYYFKNKDELAAACYLRALERFEALLADGHGERSATRRIEAFTDSHFEFQRQVALGQAERIVMFNDARAVSCPAVDEAFQEMFRHARELLQGDGEQRLPGLHADARAHLLLAQTFWAVVWMTGFELPDYGRTGRQMSSILTKGLATDGAAWPSRRPVDLGQIDEANASSEMFLRAATELINAEGYHGASVERIASRVNISKGAFYHHNTTKDELIVACFQRAFDIMWRAIRTAEQQGGSGLEILVRVACTLVELQLSGGAPLLRTSAFTTLPETIRAELMTKFSRVSIRFAEILVDGVADGSIRRCDVNVAAQMINAMINAAAELQVWAPGLTSEAACDHYVRPFFLGLLSPPAGCG